MFCDYNLSFVPKAAAEVSDFPTFLIQADNTRHGVARERTKTQVLSLHQKGQLELIVQARAIRLKGQVRAMTSCGLDESRRASWSGRSRRHFQGGGHLSEHVLDTGNCEAHGLPLTARSLQRGNDVVSNELHFEGSHDTWERFTHAMSEEHKRPNIKAVGIVRKAKNGSLASAGVRHL